MRQTKKKNPNKFVVLTTNDDFGSGDTLEEAYEDLQTTYGVDDCNEEGIHVYELKGALGKKTTCSVLKLGSKD